LLTAFVHSIKLPPISQAAIDMAICSNHEALGIFVQPMRGLMITTL
jgi:hypothetical protein